MANEFKFSTKQADKRGQLIDFGFRWYDPEIGRFTQRDPIGAAGGLNLYAYCDSDPANQADPWGLVYDINAMSRDPAGFGLGPIGQAGGAFGLTYSEDYIGPDTRGHGGDWGEDPTQRGQPKPDDPGPGALGGADSGPYQGPPWLEGAKGFFSSLGDQVSSMGYAITHPGTAWTVYNDSALGQAEAAGGATYTATKVAVGTATVAGTTAAALLVGEAVTGIRFEIHLTYTHGGGGTLPHIQPIKANPFRYLLRQPLRRDHGRTLWRWRFPPHSWGVPPWLSRILRLK